MLYCGCYHNYVIETDQYLVPFGVTKKNYSKLFCMPYTRTQMYDGLYRMLTIRPFIICSTFVDIIHYFLGGIK